MNNINDFEIQDGVILQNNGSDAEVVIPAIVTSTGEKAFSNIKTHSLVAGRKAEKDGGEVFTKELLHEHYGTELIVVMTTFNSSLTA